MATEIATERKILVLESEPLAARTIQRVLSKSFCLMLTATAREAMHALDGDQTWCGLFLNALLPGGGGLDVLAHGRERGCDCPAVVWSPVYMTGWMSRALRAGGMPLDMVDDSTVEWFAETVLPDKGSSKLQAWVKQCGLTSAETRVLCWAVRGLTNKEIADKLSISENTLKKHIGRLLRKLGTARLREAVQMVSSGDAPPQSGPRLVGQSTMAEAERDRETRLAKAAAWVASQASRTVVDADVRYAAAPKARAKKAIG